MRFIAVIKVVWIAQDTQGWYFSSKSTKQEIKNLYFSTIHVVGGASFSDDVFSCISFTGTFGNFGIKKAQQMLYQSSSLLEASLRSQETK